MSRSFGVSSIYRQKDEGFYMIQTRSKHMSAIRKRIEKPGRVRRIVRDGEVVGKGKGAWKNGMIRSAAKRDGIMRDARRLSVPYPATQLV